METQAQRPRVGNAVSNVQASQLVHDTSTWGHVKRAPTMVGHQPGNITTKDKIWTGTMTTGHLAEQANKVVGGKSLVDLD